MKFRGFFKSYWELFMQSLDWLKDYWLAYTILMIVSVIVWFLPSMISEYISEKKKSKKIEIE